MSRLSLIGHFIVYLIVRGLIWLIQAIPLSLGNRLAWVPAYVFTYVVRIRYSVADENLQYAFPELSASQRRDLILRMWHHLFLLVMEVAHTPLQLREENWRQMVTLKNIKPLVDHLLSDRPVILVTAHFGNFEFGGYILGLLGFPSGTVARNLDNPFLDRYVQRFRAQQGQYLIPKVGGADQIEEMISKGHTIALLADQDAGRKGCFASFFGRPASTFKAIALLSLQYDAPIAVVYARRLDKPLQFEIGLVDILDPREVQAPDAVMYVTQWYTSCLESVIRTAPEQYWWIHRRWKTQPKVTKTGNSKSNCEQVLLRAA
ncbi:MAG: lysophospholipid acyltransferase family protein [Thermogutta sp.]